MGTYKTQGMRVSRWEIQLGLGCRRRIVQRDSVGVDDTLHPYRGAVLSDQ